MKAGVQQIMRVMIDEETIETLRDGDGQSKVVFPLNDENSRVVELEYVADEETSEPETDNREFQ